MSGTEKRRHTTLTLNTKVEIIRRSENGAKINELAKFYGVGRATIHDIRKNKEKIEGYLSGANVGHRRTMKSGEHPQVEEALYNWYIQQKPGTIITRPMLREKAKYFYNEIMNKDDFKASSGWVEKFKKRYDLRTELSFVQKCPPSSGESGVGTDEKPVDFVQKLKDKIEECLLTPDQVYQLQETHLFWKLQPYKCFLRNMTESRLKISCCTNASGKHKLRLFVMGNGEVKENPQIPVTYKYVCEAINVREMFEDWFRNDFVAQTREMSKGKNILLVLENLYDYWNEDELNAIDETVQVVFLPKNIIEQNVIQALKTNYKKKFLISVVRDGNCDFQIALNQKTLQEELGTIAEVWHNIPCDIVASSWSQFWPSSSFDSKESVSSLCFVDAQLSEITQRLINETCLNEEDVEAWLSESYEDMMEERMAEDRNDRDETVAGGVRHEDALTAFNTCIKWAEENGVSYEDVLILRKMQSEVFVKKLLSEQDGGIKEEFCDEHS